MVRMIYFLPNDRPYRADVVQQMKDEIRTVQRFFAEQMEVHGYGRTPFRVETDAQGEPIVHRVDGLHPDKHYIDYTEDTVRAEIYPPFDIDQNVYLVVIDNSIEGIGRGESIFGGVGGRSGKQGGDALVSGRFGWGVVAHELGHAFGLLHDFRDGAYIMSYGPTYQGQERLSACHAESLSVHPYFSSDIPIAERSPPTIELISPHIYPSESRNVSVRLEVSDSDGLHQLILHADQPDNRASVKFCRGLTGENENTITFDYDGVIPSAHDPVYSRNTSLLNPLVHPIRIEAFDMNGNMSRTKFVLLSETLQPLSKISGDNQHGLPNTPLPVPFVVELRDLNDGWTRGGVPVTFTVTAGGGALSVERTETDDQGRAESTLTLGTRLGENRVEVSAEGLTVTFTAVAGAAVVIPDPNLRIAVENALGKAQGQPIAPAELAALPMLWAPSANIGDLTGLEHATDLIALSLEENAISNLTPLMGLTNLTHLGLSSNNISDLSPLADLTQLGLLWLEGNNISDLSPLAGLTNLTELYVADNNISDISAVAGFTNLTFLDFWRNSVSDLSPIAGLTKLTFLGAASNRDISDVSALAVLTNLTELFLNGNSISDISPIARLTNLKRLSLSYNSISDLSALAGLTNLTWLKLDRNAITDISTLVNLTNLTHLVLYINKISDLSPVAGLTDLTHLNLAENSISDISALTNLTNLTYLELPFNSISNLSLLVANTGLGSGDEVDVRGNPLNYLSIMAHIPSLQRRGVTVEFDDTAAKPPDVNGDGNINVLDLISIASDSGNTGANMATDVNGNGVVNILDLVLVAGMFESTAAAPAAPAQVPETLTAVEVQGWLTDAVSLEVRDLIIKRGIMVLGHLLASLTPTETELLSNYPNPFNPETWIPYRLADDGFVTLTIYDGKGQVVRSLDVGHRIAAVYESRSKAIYWDGRNNLGEAVASGVYFYHLSAGDYSNTRKMLILK